MGWPQITWIALMVSGMTVAMLKHGQPKGNWNAAWFAVNVAIFSALLYAGGFFG